MKGQNATVALSQQQYKEIITLIKNGFVLENGSIFKANDRVATALTVQANLGMRIGDVLNLTLKSFIKDADRYRLDVVEEKTGKTRTFTVPMDIYIFIIEYANRNKIGSTEKLFDITVRNVQKQLKLVTTHLKLERISTHSFRKFFATNIYINSNYNIQLVRQLLQHSNVATTQKYINISQKEIEDALANHICLV